MHQALQTHYYAWTSNEIDWAENQRYSLSHAVKAQKAKLLQTKSLMQQPLDQSALSTKAVLTDQSNELNQTSYSVKNGSKNVSYKLADTVASKAFYVFDAPATLDSFVAFVQQYQSIKLFVSKTPKSSNLKTIN